MAGALVRLAPASTAAAVVVPPLLVALVARVSPLAVLVALAWPVQ
jgi:hypothetical protein